MNFRDGTSTEGNHEQMAEEPELLYALIYVTDVLKELRYIYVTPDIDEAFRYSDTVFPGTTVVTLTVTERPGPG